MPPVPVVVIDPRRDPGPRSGPGGELLHRAQLELQGRMPGLDDRVVQGGAGPAHRLGDAEPLAGLAERPGGVFGGFNWSSQHLDLEVWRYGCRETPAGHSCDARPDVVARPAVDGAARG